MLRLNHNLIATPTADRLSSPVGGGGGGGTPAALQALTLAAATGAYAEADARPPAAGGPGSSLQSGIGSLVSLEVLQLGYNQISDLPALRLHGLLALKVLHLQGRAAWHTHKCRRAAGPAHPPPPLAECGLQHGPAPRTPEERASAPAAPGPGARRRLQALAHAALTRASNPRRPRSWSGNELVRLDGLGSLLQLRELVLDRNKIKQLEVHSLRGLSNLRELRMEENGLRSLEHFAPLPRLQTLCLGNNRVLDVGELEKLGPLPALINVHARTPRKHPHAPHATRPVAARAASATHAPTRRPRVRPHPSTRPHPGVCVRAWQVALLNNAVARKQLYRPSLLRRLPSLKLIDGREVSHEERDRAELIFASASDPRPVPSYVHEQRGNSTKVAVKLTSMNFEMMSGLSMPLGGGASSSAGAPSSHQLGIGSVPHSAGSLNGHGRPGSGSGHGGGGSCSGGGSHGGGGGGGTYFPMSAPHEGFMLPTREQQRRGHEPDPVQRGAPRRSVPGYAAPVPQRRGYNG